MCGGEYWCIQDLVEKSEERDHLEEVDVNGRII
jgi:hypothetical protein